MNLTKKNKFKLYYYSAAFLFGISLSTYGSCSLISNLNTKSENIESESDNYIYYGKGEHVVEITYDTERRKVKDEYGNERMTQLLPSQAYIVPDGYMMLSDRTIYTDNTVTYYYINNVPVNVKPGEDFGIISDIEEKKNYKKSN